MSHFTVLVTHTDEIDENEQLAPFEEYNEDISYCTCKGKDEIIAEALRIASSRATDFSTTTIPSFIGSFKGKDDSPTDTDYDWLQTRADSISEELRTWMKALAKSDITELAKDVAEWHGGEVKNGDTVITHCNPDAVWDWYVVGGRWSGELKLKNGEGVDFAEVKDIDWKKTNIPFGVIHEGNYYKSADMGYWGMTAHEKGEAEWREEFLSIINSLPPDTEVTLVDCHI